MSHMPYDDNIVQEFGRNPAACLSDFRDAPQCLGAAAVEILVNVSAKAAFSYTNIAGDNFVEQEVRG